MPSLSCDCQKVIEKEGLALFLKESLEGIFGFAQYAGIDNPQTYSLVAQFCSYAIRGIIPVGIIDNGDWSDSEICLVEFIRHMLEETKDAGYSPKAFCETLVVDVLEKEMSDLYGR